MTNPVEIFWNTFSFSFIFVVACSTLPGTELVNGIQFIYIVMPHLHSKMTCMYCWLKLCNAFYTHLCLLSRFLSLLKLLSSFFSSSALANINVVTRPACASKFCQIHCLSQFLLWFELGLGLVTTFLEAAHYVFESFLF